MAAGDARDAAIDALLDIGTPAVDAEPTDEATSDRADRPGTALEDALATALATIDGSSHAPSALPMRVAIAYSGGADSTALLHAASTLQRRGLVDPIALHVHHGLSPAADDWLAHCRREADRMGVAFDAEAVVPTRRGVSLEADARRLRYAALTRLCERHGCTVLMTAHHVDDQAETVLVNLARGAGIGGLAATARARSLGAIMLLRPLIDLTAATIHGYVDAHALRHVVDPSNQDRRFTRNAIRHEVLPALRRIAPTIATRLAQTATHAATMQRLLDEIGREDLTRDGVGRRAGDAAGERTRDDGLDVDRLASLSPARASNALRVWLAQRGLRAPSAAALREMLDQLLHASPDAQIALLHEQQTLRLYRGRVSIERGGATRPAFRAVEWHGEERIDVPDWSGVLLFHRAGASGFDAQALRDGPLSLRERRGGERMRVRADGPSRTLKNLYQEAGIAAWRRTRLPLIHVGDRLLFAAGVGANAAMTLDASSGLELIELAWQAAP